MTKRLKNGLFILFSLFTSNGLAHDGQVSGKAKALDEEGLTYPEFRFLEMEHPIERLLIWMESLIWMKTPSWYFRAGNLGNLIPSESVSVKNIP